MTAQAPLYLSAVGRLVLDDTRSGRRGTMVACLVAPNHVVTDGAPFREVADNPVPLAATLWLPQDPGGNRRSVPATVVRYDDESDLAVLRFPGEESSAPGMQQILADSLPTPGTRCEMRMPNDRSSPDSPSTDDEVVTVVLDIESVVTVDGRERLHLRAATDPPTLLAGAPVFWNDRVIGVISSTGREPVDLYAIPAATIQRVMQALTAESPAQVPDGVFSRLSASSRRALDHADAMRAAMRQDKVHMEHLLLALYEKDNGPTQRELRRTGISEEELRLQLSKIAEADLPAFGSYRVTNLDRLPLASEHVQQALALAQKEAEARGSKQIQSRHLLFGALSVRECRAVSWMFERTPAIDPSQIDMTAPPSKGGGSTTPATEAAQSDGAAAPATDRGQRRARVAPDLPDGDDLLDVKREVRAICAVIAARDTSPPLSIGLFGDWGTGKSFFMNRMEERITKLKETARSNPASAYCRNIVQLRFNAWHYMDTDLWASLAAEIFEGLARALQEDKGLLEGVGGDSNLARQRLLAATSHLRDVRAQAEQQKAEADVALRDSQQRLTSLASEEREIVARLSPKALIKSAYRFVAGREKTAQSIDHAAKQLGIPEGKALATDTRATLLELKGLWGGVRAVLLSLRSGSAALWIALLLIFGAVLGAIAVLMRYSDDLAPKVTAAAMLLGSAVGFAKKVIGPAREALATVDAARAESRDLIEGARTRRETELKRAHRAIQERSTAEETAITRVTQEIAQLEAQLEALRADRQMVDFVRAKHESTDYTKHFGVIARARNDFQQLTDLLRRVVSEGQDTAGSTADGADKRPPVPRIDRIILYIDDLDRCPEAKVVDVLQAVHLLLAFPLFVVVVGVDSRWLLHSLRQHATVFRSNDEEDDGMDTEERVHWQSTPFNYLEKIFQIPFNLQPMEKSGFIALIDDLTIPKKRADDSHGAADTPKEPPLVVIPKGGTTTIVEPLISGPTATAPAGGGAGPVPAAQSSADAVQQVSSTPATPAGATAGAATAQTVLPPAPEPPAPPAPPSDPVEPNPPFLDLTEMERRFMHRMHRLIPTPRAAKRYVNVYRLLRASLPDSKRTALEDDVQGGCRSVLLMLAILTGFPQEGTVILRELVEREPDGNWWEFIEQLARENMEQDRVAPTNGNSTDKRSSKQAARRRGATKATTEAASSGSDRAVTDRKVDDTRRNIEQRQRAQRWTDLTERMVKVRADVVNELGENPQCEDFSRWARQVARYSFEAGRVVGVGDHDAHAERQPPPLVTAEAERSPNSAA